MQPGAERLTFLFGKVAGKRAWVHTSEYTISPITSLENALVMAPDQVEMGPIIREHKRVANMDKMTAQNVGCFITLHAWRLLGKGVVASPLDTDLTDVLCDFYPEAQTYIDERSQKARRRGQSWDFLQEVLYKQRLYHQVADAEAIA